MQAFPSFGGSGVSGCRVLYGLAGLSSQSLASQNPATVKEFVSAVRQAIGYASVHPSAARAIALNYTTLPVRTS